MRSSCKLIVCVFSVVLVSCEKEEDSVHQQKYEEQRVEIETLQAEKALLEMKIQKAKTSAEMPDLVELEEKIEKAEAEKEVARKQLTEVQEQLATEKAAFSEYQEKYPGE